MRSTCSTGQNRRGSPVLLGFLIPNLLTESVSELPYQAISD